MRTCDGYYFPISYSTVPSKFGDDERLCQRLCPASEAVLYSHRNPGEDVTRAVAASGRSYSELPTAFAYRKAFNNACSCRAPGQSWADALKQLDDQTVERGDIVVQTEEQAKALSQPRLDAQGKPVPARSAFPQVRCRRPQCKPQRATQVCKRRSVPVPAEPRPSRRRRKTPASARCASVGPPFLPAAE